MIPVFASVRAPSLIVIITEDVVHSDHEVESRRGAVAVGFLDRVGPTPSGAVARDVD